MTGYRNKVAIRRNYKVQLMLHAKREKPAKIGPLAQSKKGLSKEPSTYHQVASMRLAISRQYRPYAEGTAFPSSWVIA